LATYSLTKGAVINFTRALAGEAGPQSVRVNAVAPGTIETELATSVMDAQANPDAARDAAARGHALKRLGRPGEVADAIAYLASDRASFVTGHTLVVDGGQSAVLRFRE
jgi:NAD(P)-dependent dehydrogenase (short-subunit alcohol dehydrogenase family)